MGYHGRADVYITRAPKWSGNKGLQTILVFITFLQSFSLSVRSTPAAPSLPRPCVFLHGLIRAVTSGPYCSTGELLRAVYVGIGPCEDSMVPHFLFSHYKPIAKMRFLKLPKPLFKCVWIMCSQHSPNIILCFKSLSSQSMCRCVLLSVSYFLQFKK